MTAISTSIAIEHLRAGGLDRRALPDDIGPRVAEGVSAILKELGDAPAVLELAIGASGIGRALGDCGINVTTIDPADGTPRRKRFDAALFTHSLSAVADPAATVGETLKLVRQGGMILRATALRDAREDAAEDAIHTAIARAAGLALPPDSPREQSLVGVFVREVEKAGAWLEVVEVGQWWEPVSGESILRSWASGAVPGTAEVPAGILDRALADARPEVDLLFGGLDRPAEARRSFSVMVARLP